MRGSVFLIADNTGRAYLSNVPLSTEHNPGSACYVLLATIGIPLQNVLMEGDTFSAKNVCHSMLQSAQEYLIYVSVGNRIYRQCVGIPMGTDCDPLAAN